MNDDRTLLPEQIRNLPTRGPKGTIHTDDYLTGHRAARHAAAELVAAALSAAPAQEPVAWVDGAALRFLADPERGPDAYIETSLNKSNPAGTRTALYTSALPQEVKEVKALTDSDQMRAEFMAWVQDRGCDTDGAWSAWQACWNLRGAQEGKAGEPGRQELLAVAQMVIEEYAGGGDWQSVERAARAAMSATLASREGEQR